MVVVWPRNTNPINPLIPADTLFKPVFIQELMSNRMNSPKKRELLLYPNPAKNLVKIGHSLQIQPDEISMFDLTGRNINVTINNSIIDVKNLPSGIYIVQLTREDRAIRQKLVVQ